MKKYYAPDLKARIVRSYLGGKTITELASENKIDIKNCYFYIVPLFSHLFIFASRKESVCSLMEWKDYDTKAQKFLLNYINSQIDFMLDYLP